jgi:DNA invertase Pin-like site-specific DNA recombinase
MEKENCIIYCRVSTSKQAQEGESLNVQEKHCRSIAKSKNLNVVSVFREQFSGKHNSRPVFDEMFSFIKKSSENIKYLVFRDIDRLTRGGSFSYQEIKRDLESMGVQLLDSNGIIQPTKNIMLERYGFDYDFGKNSLSDIAEKMKADIAENEKNNILQRLTGGSIESVSDGYKVRRSNDGYLNKKVFVGGMKKKVIQVEDPERARFYREMFNLRVSDCYSDIGIVDKINAMGFKTKIMNRWDKSHENIIGYIGGNPLKVKQLQRIIQNPIYCGVICEKWTKNKPVRAQYDGLVTIDIFNEANRGKVYVKDNKDGSLEILYNYHPTKVIQRRKKNNPLFPYKFILCPECKKPFLGSSPTGKSGQRFAIYHCARGHKYIGINKKTFDGNIETFVEKIKYTRNKDFINSLECVLQDIFSKRKKKLADNSLDVASNINTLEAKKKQAVNALITLNSNIAKKEIEKRIDDLDSQIKTSNKQLGKVRITSDDISKFTKYARKIMEHPEEMLLDSTNMEKQQSLFGVVFKQYPTYDEIVNGTPKLSLIFELSKTYENDESLLVVHFVLERS